jgi:hypothetical protein
MIITTKVVRNWLLFTGVGLSLSLAGCECEGDSPPLGRLAPSISLDESPLDFGEVPVGATKELPLEVKNIGQLQLQVCARAPDEGKTAPAHCVTLSTFEPAGAPFSAVYESTEEDGTWVVDSAATREIILRFTPQAEGLAEGSFLLVHDDQPNNPKTISLRGVGVRPQVDVAPLALDFGEVTVGQSKTMMLTLTNRTQFAQPVSVGPIDQTALVFGVRSAAGAEAPLGQALVVEVPGNGSTTVQVSFSPLESGQATTMLQVRYCPSGCDVSVLLLGQGVKPEFVVEPSSLDFGRLAEGQSATQTFRVRNIGISRLMVNTIELDAGTSSEYSIAPQMGLPYELAPMSELTVAVLYQGTTPGLDTGRVRVDTTAWDNPATPNDERIAFVDLRAESSGPDIAALPAAVNFGTLAIMTGMSTRNVILENQGNAPLTISNIQLNGPSVGSELTMPTVPGVPSVLAPGQTVQISLRYAPTNAGLDEAQLVIVSDDRDESPLVIQVAGVGGVPTTCALQVSPTNVNFGLVERGRVATLPVDLRNLGAQACNISGLVTSGDPSFAVRNPMAATVAPGSTHRVELTYSPTAYATHTGQLAVTSDDPAQPTINVPLSGTSAPSDVRVIPSELDFAVVPVTCGSPARSITLYNTGTRTVTVNRVYMDPGTTSEFELCAQGAGSFAWCTAPFSTPSSVPAGGSVSFSLRYRPRDIGADNGVVFIEHSAAPVPVAVPLRGSGDVSPTVTDRFTQVPTPEADIMFVVDNSCSMSEEQANLGRNLQSFLTYAQTAMVDYHIAVTTTDVDVSTAGQFVRGGGAAIITPQTANASQVFQRNTAIGTGGSSDEQGLEAAYLALTDPNLSGANAGFLRQDAALAVIVVSDEEDFSNRQVSFYESFFRNLKGFQNQSQFSFSAIVTPRGGCSNGASDGLRYIQIAQATGGVVESICTANWGNTLSNIGLNTFGLRSRFNLTAQPVPSTIAVTVNAMPSPMVTPGGVMQWRYDAPTNAVVFNTGYVPTANSIIEITYTVACLP